MILAIIQARMASTRLPGKMMLKAVDKTMLELMIERVSKSKKLDKIVVATSTNKLDDVIEDVCKKIQIDCFRGSEDDVLLRYKNAAEFYNGDIIVRLCGDCPLIDAKTIDTTIDSYLNAAYDYVSNLFPTPRTYPDGTSVEVFSKKILDQIERETKKPSDREHVTFFLWMQPHKFKIYRLDYEKDLSKYRFNLDYKVDYDLIKKVFENFVSKNRYFEIKDVTTWLDDNPEIFNINSHIEPQKGWVKSFERDKEMGF